MSMKLNGLMAGNMASDHTLLQACFAQYVTAYQADPTFCVPPAVRELYQAQGAKTQVVLLGTTPFSQLFLSEACDRVEVVGVVDDFKAGKQADFHGTPVISSQALVSRAQSTPLVCINGCRYDHSRRYFKNLTLRHGLPMLNFEQALRWLAISPAKDYRLDDWGGYIAEHAQQLITLAGRLDDDYSRVTLFSVLLAHLTCDPEWILNCAKPYLTLYFRSGLWLPDQNERFADCGASIAESTKAFIDASHGHFKKIWMIEPDEVNRATLAEFITGYERDWSLNAPGSIELLGHAVGSADSTMPFLHQGGHGGHLLSMPTDQAICRDVSVRRLDALLDDMPTLIKMDIEGAELEALKGASGLIAEGKPKLAISAYHRPSDLLDISRYVNSVRSDYRIGLRHHTEERWDTCLYFY